MSDQRKYLLGLSILVCFLFGNVGANADTLYVSEYSAQAIDKVDSSGSSSIFASMPLASGLAFDGSGNLYAEGGNGAEWWIRKYGPSGGNGTFFASVDSPPTGLAIDSSGNLFVAAGNNIEKFDASGNESLFASSLALAPSSFATGLAFDSGGNLYASWGGMILKFDPSGNRSTFASGLHTSSGLAFDSIGNLYVAIPDNGLGLALIDKFDSNGTKSTFVSGGYLNNPQGIVGPRLPLWVELFACRACHTTCSDNA